MKNLIFMNIFEQDTESGIIWTYLKTVIIDFDKASSSEYRNKILCELMEINEIYEIIYAKGFMPNHYNVFVKEKQ